MSFIVVIPTTSEAVVSIIATDTLKVKACQSTLYECFIRKINKSVTAGRKEKNEMIHNTHFQSIH
uniref:Uncharacterized protein n=1 Tax=Onchocerca volvulus TaxID=6282 RepID=A0A8R1XVB6_ONCVO